MGKIKWFTSAVLILSGLLMLAACSSAPSQPITPTAPNSVPGQVAAPSTATAVPSPITALPPAAATVIVGESSVVTAAPTSAPTGAASAVAQSNPQPSATAPILASLKYQLISQFAGAGNSKGILFCDPDFYPVARIGAEQANAAKLFPAIQQDQATFQAIVTQLGLTGTSSFTTDQQLLIYREYKVLRAILLQPATGGYQFQISYQTASGKFQVSGTISADGNVSAQPPQPLPGKGINCPICLVAGTLIDTPAGAVAVKDLQVGMSVWTVDGQGIRRAVTILKTAHVAVPFGHSVIHLRLSDGRELWASPPHPTADGRSLSSLAFGDSLDGATVISVEQVSYPDDATYDILPAGDTGFYWANGILMGSTLTDLNRIQLSIRAAVIDLPAASKMSTTSSTPNPYSETPNTPPVPGIPDIRLPVWLPVTLLAATLAILFYRLLLGDVLFWGLPSLQFYPWRQFAISELQAGRLPLWNPYNGAGAPLLANYQSALLYPPNLLSLVLIPGPQAMGLLALAHLFWAGLGAYLYGRALALPRFACAIGMLAYALNGAVVARLGTQPMVDVAAWLPWLLLAAERILRRPSPSNAALLTLCAALQLLSGHAQWTFYSLLLVALYVLYRIFVAPIGISTSLPHPPSVRARSIVPLRREGLGVRFRILALISGSLALALGLAAIQLLPTAELQHESQRAGGLGEQVALNFSDEWPGLILQANPFFFGNPGDGSYAINGAHFEIDAYVGILPLVLALLGVGHVIRRWRRLRPLHNGNLPVALVPFFGTLVVIAFVFALGRNSALYVFLYHHMPTFNEFQAPARWLLWAVCGFSVLAAIGAALWQPNRLMRPRARLGLAGAIGFTVVAGLLTQLVPGVIARGLFTLGVQLACVALAFVLQPVAIQSARFTAAYRRWMVGVLIFVAADLIWANALLNPTVTASFYDSHPAPDSTVAGRTFQPDDQINTAEFSQFLLFNDYRVAIQRQEAYRATDLPNMNLLDRQPSFNTFEPLRPSAIDQLTQLLDAKPDPGLTQPPRIETLQEAAAIETTANPDPPRAWLVGQTVPTDDAFNSMKDSQWQPYRSAFVEADAPPLNGPSATGNDSVVITHETPLELDFSTQSSGPAALIVADTWYPGWTATLDGQPTPIYRANGAFRAVYLTAAGKHTVIMRYAPESLVIGAVISAASVLILILGLLAWRIVRVWPSPPASLSFSH